MGRIVIPGRPQSRPDTSKGMEYKEQIQRLMAEQLGGILLFPEAMLTLSATLYYSVPDGAPDDLPSMPRRWPEFSIPRPDHAMCIILSALKGSLYSSSEQVSPMSVNRIVQPGHLLEATWGYDCRRGLAVIEYGPATH
ncbi:hypothetical protein [Deinococcus cellulosilyticus]|uniref:Uncharacterized protein n=1 Tax=Deinococcus cellulosilyticus (strain DSM 18568 / NBRC 106333 / KACC 11606 / 5516J-15) TaxID=1223518 RepID=A0A511N405_DEIC1|nr:hypothetical protein [Deinococcus cellulosilyticus]GEM47198.1 hypothetical protein DC3_28330 [Deinococcus cellulosilyticus NBRC 106333 = KACC 11606]